MAPWNNAFAAVGAAAENFQKEIAPQVQASLEGTVTKVGQHVQNDIVPAVRAAVNHAHVSKDIAPAVKGGIDGALARLREKFGNNFENIPQVALQTAEEAQAWVAANPRNTAIIVTSTIVLLAPGLVTSPTLGALGFGAKGVGAGKVAAGVQAGIGNVAAGSSFAMLQSAGAGGFGSVIVNGVVQGISGIVLGSTFTETLMKTTEGKEKPLEKL